MAIDPNIDEVPVARAARILGVQAHHVRRLAKQGHLAAWGSRSDRRYSLASIHAYRSKKIGQTQMNRTCSFEMSHCDFKLEIEGDADMKKIQIKPGAKQQAAAVGLDALIRAGGVPSVQISGERFYSATYLIRTLGLTVPPSSPKPRA